MRSFPPLSAVATRGAVGVPWCCTSSERMGITLLFAALVWLLGIYAFLGRGAGGLLHSVAPPTHHSHRTDLTPHGAIHSAHTSQRYTPPVTNPATVAGAASPQVDRPSAVTRGFAFSKLANLQQEIREELHNIFLHDDHYEGKGDHDDENEQPEDADADEVSHKPVAKPAAGQTVASNAEEPLVAGVHLVEAGSSAGGMVNPAIVILTYKRRQYLTRTLDSLMLAPGLDKFELYVSQDAGPDVPDLSDLVAKYAGVTNLHLLHHPRVALLVSDQSATAYLAQHYKWVLDKLFLEEDGKQHSHVVIMEDDMVVASDFLTLFSETAPLLDLDPTLLCVSSWNDLGMESLVADSRRLMRTDYFPGLGWMMNRRIWSELSPAFPLDQWDHFMRLDTTHQGRDCLIPEIARNHNIGQEGTNMGDNFYQRYLAPIALASGPPVSFLRKHHDQQDDPAHEGADEEGAPTTFITGVEGLEHLQGPHYEREMYRRVRAATLLGNIHDSAVQNRIRTGLAFHPEMPSAPNSNGESTLLSDPSESEWLVTYERREYPLLAGLLGVISVPRSIHKGLSSVRLGKHLLWMADVKICPYLPAELQFSRDLSLHAIAARQDESCTDACARQVRTDDGVTAPHPMKCSVEHFQFINQCSALREAFPNGCSKGCRGGVAGLDVPNHVDNPAKAELYGYCLTTEGEPTCEAKHWSASRLCPCVNK